MAADILEAVTPLLIDLLALLLSIAIAWLSIQVHRYLGVQVEARHREALHSAIMTGVLRAKELGGDRNAIVAETLLYAKRSVPDAIRVLAAEDGILWELAEAKLRQVVDTVAPNR